jgi:beta-lactamase regulating signal transducer with metallopeptidase domain/alpha-tubulin suppressor-like RCC1 family protein
MDFETIFHTTLGASVLTIVILLIRRLFGEKINPNIRYLLWLFVALRILIPVSIDYTLPEIGWLGGEKEQVFVQDTVGITDKWKQQDILEFFNNIDNNRASNTGKLPNTSAQSFVRKENLNIDKLLFMIWLIGLIGLGSYIIINNIRFYVMLKKQRKAVGMIRNEISVYELRGYNCLIGIFNPCIYIDPKVHENLKLSQHVILHELQHYKTRDNFWIVIRSLCLILQWFNPLIWLAYVESGRDCELACDYRVIKDMEKEERFLYGESLLSVAGLHVDTRKNACLVASMGREKKIMKQRLENIMKFSRNHKKICILPCLLLIFVAIAMFVNVKLKPENTYTKGADNNIESTYNENQEKEEKLEGTEGESEIQKIQLDIKDFYITNAGDPSNLYYIDDQKTLWGSGVNQYGQLGQGTQDEEFHENLVKIADNVIHLDYSQAGYMIYLTEEHKLYGCGNGGVGALQQLDSFSEEQFINGRSYAVTKPILLMENVIYARCGRNDIVVIDKDDNVWNWGVIWYNNRDSFDYQKEPKKILDNTVLVTGGMYNHAALKEDGSVWTWGYNYTGNCGIANESVVSKPQNVAEDVNMVWTGSLNYNIDCRDIRELGDFFERGLENTIIQKADGSFWICGANVGTEEKLLSKYYEVVDYRIICTHEFIPYEIEEENFSGTLQ